MTNEEIVGRIQQGEAGLMERLLEQNRGFIYTVARRYLPAAIRNRGMDLENLSQAACVGMIEAVPAWEAERGAFLTVAIYYMTCSIRQELGVLTTKQRFENQEPPLLLSTPTGEDEGGDALLDLIGDPAAADPVSLNGVRGGSVRYTFIFCLEEYTYTSAAEAGVMRREQLRNVIVKYMNADVWIFFSEL